MKKSLFLFFFFFCLSINILTAQSRYALVIGNADYDHLTSLKNPVNDATDMAKSLQRIGFEVDLLTNAELNDMESAAIRLKNKLSSGGDDVLGLFFYAGHGIQSSNGDNYLIPSPASIQGEAFLRTKALSAQTVLDLMQEAGNGLNLVFLDACRDNPFSWGRSSERGLAVVGNQPTGSIIVYATSAGSIALDGTGRNGVFTGELLKNLETPGIDLNTLLDRTARGVQQVSENRQNPAIYKQFFGTTYLVPSSTNTNSLNKSNMGQFSQESNSIVFKKNAMNPLSSIKIEPSGQKIVLIGDKEFPFKNGFGAYNDYLLNKYPNDMQLNSIVDEYKKTNMITQCLGYGGLATMCGGLVWLVCNMGKVANDTYDGSLENGGISIAFGPLLCAGVGSILTMIAIKRQEAPPKDVIEYYNNTYCD